MSFDLQVFLALSIWWNLGAILVFLLGLLLIVVILIQDSKESGLGGAFGGGMGGEILGARGQKEITRFTAILGGILALLIIVLGVKGDPGRRRELPGDPTGTTPAITEGGEESADAEGGAEESTKSTSETPPDKSPGGGADSK